MSADAFVYLPALVKHAAINGFICTQILLVLIQLYRFFMGHMIWRAQQWPLYFREARLKCLHSTIDEAWTRRDIIVNCIDNDLMRY